MDGIIRDIPSDQSFSMVDINHGSSLDVSRARQQNNSSDKEPAMLSHKEPSYLTLRMPPELSDVDDDDAGNKEVMSDDEFGDENNQNRINHWEEEESEPDLEKRKRKRTLRYLKTIATSLSLLPILYFFVCSLDLLTSGFQLLAGKTAGDIFQKSSLLQNPIAGLMMGVLVTVLVQSSSTTTSIIVSMVSSGIIPVKYSIPMIMGANVGTSTTNTLVAIGQLDNVAEFRRAFSGATIHDVFNWLNVIIQLPLEAGTGYLTKMTGKMVEGINYTTDTSDPQFLNAITKPLTEKIIQLNWTVVEKIAQNVSLPANITLKKQWCGEDVEYNSTLNMSITTLTECKYLFKNLNWPDWGIGLLITIIALAGLIICLLLMVRVLRFLLEGQISKVLRKTIDKDLPGIFRYLTPYLFVLVGVGFTILVQSSSVFTSALTPLVGTGVISLERMYPLTLGANMGTTVTAILSAFASKTVSKLRDSLQAALAHLFFNIFGTIIFFVIVPCRQIPIKGAKFLGKQTSKYKWFAILYIVLAFLVIPLILLGLSVAGTVYCVVAVVLMVLIVSVVILLNYLMKRHSKILPQWLKNWKFLPEPLRSLAPYDRALSKIKIVSSGWIRSHVIRPDSSVSSMTHLFRSSKNLQATDAESNI